MSKKPIILIIDDDTEEHGFIKTILNESDLKADIISCFNGETALLFLENIPLYDLSYPDLILLDIELPQMDGKQVLSILKNNPLWGSIPVIVMSTFNDVVIINYCYTYGANAYFQKPDTYPEISNTINSIYKFWLG